MSGDDEGISAGDGPPQLEGLPKQILRRSLISIRHFRSELDALRSEYAEREDLPGLRTLVDAMGAFLAETEREVIILSRRLYAEIEEGHGDRTATRFREVVGGLVRSLEFEFPQLLSLAGEPHGREIEALILPFSTLLGQLFGEEPRSIEVIFEPGEEYAFERSVLERLVEAARSFTPELRRQFENFPQLIAIAYPKQREPEVLGHGMIAHEIAHNLLEWTRPPEHEVAPIYEPFRRAADQHSAALVARLEELASNDKLPFEPTAGDDEDPREDESPAEQAGRAMSRLQRWFEEIACDALALGMIGPAYVFALAELDLALDRWWQIRGAAGFATHPGLARRLGYLIPLARDTYLGGDGLAASTLHEAIDELERDLPEVSDEILDEEDTLLRTAVVGLFGSDAVVEVLGLARYFPENFRVEIELVREKLAAGIPPAERIHGRRVRGPQEDPAEKSDEAWSRRMRWQSIMNGAYAWWFEGGPRDTGPEAPRIFPDGRRVARDWIEFNDYIRGSIELANLQFQLSESRGRLDGLNKPRRG